MHGAAHRAAAHLDTGRFFAPDPGRLRLRFALRVLASVSITLFALQMLARALAGTFRDGR